MHCEVVKWVLAYNEDFVACMVRIFYFNLLLKFSMTIHLPTVFAVNSYYYKSGSQYTLYMASYLAQPLNQLLVTSCLAGSTNQFLFANVSCWQIGRLTTGYSAV